VYGDAFAHFILVMYHLTINKVSRGQKGKYQKEAQVRKTLTDKIISSEHTTQRQKNMSIPLTNWMNSDKKKCNTALELQTQNT
jgi:hypothetical protein